MLKKKRKKQRRKERRARILEKEEKEGMVEASGTQLDTQRAEWRSEVSSTLSPHDAAITPTSGIKLEELKPPDIQDIFKLPKEWTRAHDSPPHIAPKCRRRVEGLLEPDEGAVLEDLPPVSEHQPIATLSHGLERVLFNPGVHWLQDPRSRVYNFTPWLETIPKVNDFAFERLGGFIRSSRDEDLWALARQQKRRFAGSTSSLTGMLNQIYFLISNDKGVDTSILSRHFRNEPRTFTPGQRMPKTVILNHDEGVYAIDSYEKGGDSDKNILTWMGTLLEKFMTMTPEEFTTFTRSEAATEVKDSSLREAYRYAKSKRFVMRSQLDCYDSRLPGTGVFDIKTRACLPIRLDILNFEENSGYLIKTQHGLIESFEKEYYDLIRSAFLKYSFQVRIGNMDGVIVAYHNTSRMFGFQYISLPEMDACLFGPGEGVGDRVFSKCIGLLENVMEEVVLCFPDESIKCTFETREGTQYMSVYVEPANWSGDESERPIKLLKVEATSFNGDLFIRGERAVSSTEPWTIHYVISQLSLPEEEIRTLLQGVEARQFRAYNIPTGVDPDSLQSFWDTLNFGGKPVEEVVTTFRPEVFKPPTKNVAMLRMMARAGREESDRMAQLEFGKQKIVLGEPMETYRSDSSAIVGVSGIALDEPSEDPVIPSTSDPSAIEPSATIVDASHDSENIETPIGLGQP
ncbi:RNA processing-related protein, mitochondrial RNA degradation [Laccaria bicolor S238N-H82]|uniref:RNA processing-related protein, mitochondrial RNA degradation n=1 Tax=Laccaria bicolor (strain S238N-H82 / ATCC MYA-4686) TaxID=486041 RepID=B0CVU4_LACBS|nr:RNA processing-related protein, mitochondrial RNA degradation [Laccaria bicolor S238N-H82]EDR13806.1 RNA processing-related protein, mitochondrial RNA degradation [Laccaria bicolor S238N-H82]|eukprot:XP_001876304.1 RNA processing-related protein, mitochondrial RNA degradation [Laccaria bicolor S238N-H82]